jgi:hypothetical protein
MPQASNELRSLMLKWFGHEVSDYGPSLFLRARGWMDRGGIIEPPTPAHEPSLYELACIQFLCDEWDYGYRGRPRL